ncbi:hypothetical protein JTB14_036850 [Gonioctena quinquepunctata]|nr:hypothetical protein JTB14_036850 [Gonioctena quinquepunctata]
MDRWKGKVAIVTGASSGIGAAIVKKLVEEDLIVVGLARRVDRMEELRDELVTKKTNFHPLKCDISKESDTQSAFKYVVDNIGPIHVLVNNAGCVTNSSLALGPTETWKQVLDVNVLGLCVATREAIKDMRKNNVDGHIIHMNSILGHNIVEIDGLNIYPATKYAVTAMTETLRKEFNKMKSKIKITSISPGIVATDIFSAGNLDQIERQLKNDEIPCLASEDVADAVYYILSTPPKVNITELTIRPVNEDL